MKRQDAEELALAYCLRNVDRVKMNVPGFTRPQCEKLALEQARDHYGENLTAAALTRIRRQLRATRRSASPSRGSSPTRP